MLKKQIDNVPYALLNYRDVVKPPGIEQNGNRYYGKNETPISNFILARIAKYSEADNIGNTESFVVLEAIRADEKVFHFAIPSDEVKASNIIKYLPDGSYYFNISEKRLEKKLKDIISMSLDCTEPQEFRSVESGFIHDAVLSMQICLRKNTRL